jgi:tetratricopeptide (TPR) repeat protein
LSNGLSPELGPPLLTGIDPEHRSTAELLIDMALGAIKRDDARRAEQFVDYSLGLLQTARAYSVRGEISLTRANPKAALESWEHALGLEPGHFYTLINLGKYYLQQQEAEKAAEYLDRAIRVDPDSARARHLRGLAFQAIGDVAGAVGEYRRALPDRNYVKGIKTFYLNFGTALASLGLYEEASQMLEEYTALVPGDFDGQYHLGAAYEIIAERTLDDLYTHRAIERLSRAVALKPTQAMPHYYLSKALRRLGRYDEAEAEFELYERYLAR